MNALKGFQDRLLDELCDAHPANVHTAPPELESSTPAPVSRLRASRLEVRRLTAAAGVAALAALLTVAPAVLDRDAGAPARAQTRGDRVQASLVVGVQVTGPGEVLAQQPVGR